MKVFTANPFWITRSSLLAYLPISFVSVPVALTNSTVPIEKLILLSTFLTLVVSLLVLVMIPLKGILTSNLIKFASFFLALALIGAVRGFLLFDLLDWLEIESSASLPARIIASSASVIFWLSAISITTSALEDNRRRYQNRFAQKALAVAGQSSNSPANLVQKIDRLSNIKALQNSLSNIADEARRAKISEGDLLVAAAKLRDEIENSLRPLSHRVWYNETSGQPQFRLVGLLHQALRSPGFSPITTGAITFLWFLAGAGAFGPLLPVALGALSAGLFVSILTAISKRALRNKTIRPALTTILFPGIAMLSHAMSNRFVFIATGQSWVDDQFASFIWMSLTLTGVLLAISALHTVQSDLVLLEQMLDDVSLDIDGETRAKFAGFLHNTLQSELSALAIRLEMAHSDNPNMANQVIARLEELSKTSIGEEFSNREDNPAHKLRQVVAGWDGIIEIDLTVCKKLSASPVSMALFVEVVQEAVSNAVRHSHASRITIFTYEHEDAIRVEISNPHSGKTEYTASLGQAWLEKFATDIQKSVSANSEYKIEFLLKAT